MDGELGIKEKTYDLGNSEILREDRKAKKGMKVRLMIAHLTLEC